MHILTICTDFPYSKKGKTITQGGGGACILQLVKALLERGVNISVLTRREKDFDNELVRCPVHRTGFFYLGFRESKITHSVFALPKAISLLRKNKFDIIHSHNPAAGLLGLFCAKLFRKPHILTMHGPWSKVRQNHFTRFLARLIEGFVIKNSDITTCDSQILSIEMKSRYGADPLTITNAVNPDDFPEVEKSEARKRLNIYTNNPIILFTGRFVAEKGIDILLDAAAMILEKRNDLLFLLIGGGFDEHLVREWLARHEDYKGNILLTPYLSYENMNYAYRSSDVFVLPSLAEGFSRSIMEAIVCGVPVVATNIGGNSELVGDGRGILVPVKNPSEIAAAISKLLSSPEFSTNLSKNAKNYAINNLTIKKRIDTFMEAYKSLVV